MNPHSTPSLNTTRAHRARGPAGRLLPLLALGALLLGSWQRVNKVHQRRQLAKPAPLPPRVQTWEGEGGRVDEDGPPAAT